MKKSEEVARLSPKTDTDVLSALKGSAFHPIISNNISAKSLNQPNLSLPPISITPTQISGRQAPWQSEFIAGSLTQ